MTDSKTYNTQQRKLILDCFRKEQGKGMSVKDLLTCLCEEKVGRSTVYRQLDKLVSESVLMRYTTDDGVCVYSLNAHCHGEHYHLKCTSCGKTVHLDNEASAVMRERLRINDFDISGADTLLLGKCTECKAHD